MYKPRTSTDSLVKCDRNNLLVFTYIKCQAFKFTLRPWQDHCPRNVGDSINPLVTPQSNARLSSFRPATCYRLLIQNGRSCCHPHANFTGTVFAFISFSRRCVNSDSQLNDVIRETCLISLFCASIMMG
jgi:hypothetical protein